MSLDGWGYRKRHVISGVELADYPVKIRVYRTTGSDSGDVVYIGTKCREDYGDIRFTTSDRVTELNYWIEVIEATYADIWINTTIATSGSTIYIYYGNAEATTTSSGDDTFELFDDFSGDSVDLEKWNVLHTPTITGGALLLNEYNERIQSKQTFGLGYSLRTKIKANNKNYTFFGATAAGIGLNSKPSAQFVYGGSSSVNAAWSAATQTTETTSLPFTSLTYGIYEVSRLSNYTNKFYVNGTLFITHTNGSGDCVSGNAIPWTFQNYQSSAGLTVYVDWVAIRKCSATEPTHGEWGAEEMVVDPFEFTSKYHLGCIQAPFVSIYSYDSRVRFVSRYAINAIIEFTSKYDLIPGRSFTSPYRILVSKDFTSSITQGGINKADFRTRIESARKTIAAMFEER